MVSTTTLTALIFTIYTFLNFWGGPCDRPLAYDIGRFDSQFGVTEFEFKQQILRAEAVWEEALGRNFFIYDEKANFKINLIYDQRQLETMRKQKTESGLAAAENVLNNLDVRFSNFKTAYENQKNLHQQTSSLFKQKQASYEQEVNYWNSRGGAPPAEYEALQNRAKILNAEANQLNIQAANLNTQATELDALLEERNRAASEYNKIVKNYNQKYGHGLEFNQAEYTNQAINVYQFGDKNSLLLALTHELGHALGMGHVETPGSIMYYLASGFGDDLVEPSPEDLAELKRVCRIE